MKRMSESPSQDEPQIKCPQCGEPVIRTHAGEVDASSPQQIEFTCPNKHRTVVVLVETSDDDLDPAE
jgi:hypothetical protein